MTPASYSNQNRYDVRLGHIHVTVEGNTHDEAIQNARRAFCLDMPRLYDVIQAYTPDRFEVSQIDKKHWT